MSKGGNSQTSTSNVSSPAYLSNANVDATGAATSLYNAGAPTYYSGEGVAPMNAAQTAAINNTIGLTNAGSPGLTAANNATLGILNTPSGSGNPVLQQLMDTAGKQAVGAVNGSFNGANRMGSGANAATAGTAYANASLPYLFQQYNADNTNKLTASAQQPALDNQGYARQAYAGEAAGQQQTQQQNEDTANLTAYNYNAQEPENFLNNYLQQLYGNPANNTQTTSTSTSKSSGGALSDALAIGSLLAAPMTGGMSLAGMGASAAGGFGSILSGIGASSMAGSLAGGMNSMGLGNAAYSLLDH